MHRLHHCHHIYGCTHLVVVRNPLHRRILATTATTTTTIAGRRHSFCTSLFFYTPRQRL